MARRRGGAACAVATLLALSADEPVTCLHENHASGLVVVGSANGAVRLLFPTASAASEGQERGELDNTADDRDVELGVTDNEGVGSGAGKDEYDYVLLRKKSVEGVRCAFIDMASGKLFVGAGDSAILVWDLRSLTPRSIGERWGANFETFAFDRVHTFGTCSNAFLFNHRERFLLVIKKSIRIHEMNFAASARAAESANSGKNLQGVVPPVGDANGSTPAPVNKELDMTTPKTAMPCHFDGHFLTFINAENKGEFDLEVRDMSSDKREMVRKVTLRRQLLNDLAPRAVQTCGDVLLAVTNLTKLSAWSISSGRQLFSSAVHPSSADIVVAVLLRVRPRSHQQALEEDPESTAVVSINKAGSVVVSHLGKPLQVMQLPSSQACFALGGPYLLSATFAAIENAADDDLASSPPKLQSLLYTDDTGLHKLSVL